MAAVSQSKFFSFITSDYKSKLDGVNDTTGLEINPFGNPHFWFFTWKLPGNTVHVWLDLV
jgi:hypothetical protein